MTAKGHRSATGTAGVSVLAGLRDTAAREALLGVLGDVFREHGFAGASLTAITQATGLGKGSLYHFFPGGKEQMAAEVIAHVDAWFARHVFLPLRRDADAQAAIAAMFDSVDDYFRSGRRLCVVGVFALSGRREFAEAVSGYFKAWRAALASALRRAGHERARAIRLSEEIVSDIQGGLVLARALDEPAVFARKLDRLRQAARADRSAAQSC